MKLCLLHECDEPSRSNNTLVRRPLMFHGCVHIYPFVYKRLRGGSSFSPHAWSAQTPFCRQTKLLNSAKKRIGTVPFIPQHGVIIHKAAPVGWCTFTYREAAHWESWITPHSEAFYKNWFMYQCHFCCVCVCVDLSHSQKNELIPFSQFWSTSPCEMLC